MKLYYTARSPYARKVRVAALELNIKLQLIETDLMNRPPELLTANPLGRIPVLHLDDGRSLSDSSLICDYLQAMQPEPRLLPVDSEHRWVVLNLDLMAKGLMDVTVATYMEKVRHPEQYNAAFIIRQEEAIQRTLSYFNEHSAHLAELSIASISVACALGYLQFRLPHVWADNSYEQLRQWYGTINQRVSFLDTRPVG